MVVFSKNEVVCHPAYSLLRFPAQKLKAGGGKILNHPVHPGAANNINAILREELKIILAFARHWFLHFLCW
jgi:hypothetical protein